MKQEKHELLHKLIQQHPDDSLEQFQAFREMSMMYQSAIREITTKLEILNDELSLRHNQNPIESIKSRVKTPLSIMKKLERKGKEISIESVADCIYDVAGVRVICSFIDDIYRVADMLRAQDDVTVIAIKDYIKNPKPNGYRSYHMIVEIPVFFSDRKQNLNVEIQIRTVAMDFWASLEHQLKYKTEIEHAEKITEELKKCADVVAAADEHMMVIRKMVEQQKTKERLDE